MNPYNCAFGINSSHTLITFTMVWNTKARCVWIVMIIQIAGSCSLSFKCEDNCYGCSTTSIVCHFEAEDFVRLEDILHVLPSYTQTFSLLADTDVFFGDSTHFDHLIGLKILNITSDISVVKLEFSGADYLQNVFVSLTNLRVLMINIPWAFNLPLDDLF